MTNRHAYSVIGAAVLSSAAVAFAQTYDPQTSEAQADEPAAAATIGQADTEDMPITLVGCIQRESDYRREHDSGRGGFLSTGLGLGNEYVLINASRAGSTGSSAPIDCASATTGEAYELSGKAEGDLEPFVGRLVEINGTLKRADLDDDDVVGTTGTTAARPSGGFDPLGQDLRLHEVDVMSFREVMAQAAQPVSPAPAEEPEAVGTTGIAEEEAAAEPAEEEEAAEQPGAAEFEQQAAAEQLPRTASPLPLAGLLGLLSLAGALGVRRLRRR